MNTLGNLFSQIPNKMSCNTDLQQTNNTQQETISRPITEHIIRDILDLGYNHENIYHIIIHLVLCYFC